MQAKVARPRSFAGAGLLTAGGVEVIETRVLRPAAIDGAAYTALAFILPLASPVPRAIVLANGHPVLVTASATPTPFVPRVEGTQAGTALTLVSTTPRNRDKQAIKGPSPSIPYGPVRDRAPRAKGDVVHTRKR